MQESSLVIFDHCRYMCNTLIIINSPERPKSQRKYIPKEKKKKGNLVYEPKNSTITYPEMDRKEGKRLLIYGTYTKDENEELLKIDAYQSPVHHSRRNMTRLQLSMRTDLKIASYLGLSCMPLNCLNYQ